MPVVVDASALAAVLFGEAEAPAIAARLEDAELIAASLLPYEVANTAVMKVRRGEMTAAAAADAVGLLESFRVRLEGVPPVAAFDLARSSGLTAYDASYLWLARELNADLVTLDKPLDVAWRRMRDDG